MKRIDALATGPLLLVAPTALAAETPRVRLVAQPDDPAAGLPPAARR